MDYIYLEFFLNTYVQILSVPESTALRTIGYIFQLTVHVEHSQLAFSTVFPNENTVHIHNYIKMKKAYGHKKIFQLCLPFLSP